jgi:nucleoside-diphosphate-sugar epimerase
MSTSRLSGSGGERIVAGRERIVVTGAGGWLGLATLELLHRALGPAFAERVVCFGSNTRTLSLRGDVEVSQLGLERIGELPARPSLVLHLAYLTRDRAEAMPAEDYEAANRALSNRVLGALEPIGAQAVFIPSSGAAYSADDPAAPDALRLYGRLKAEEEAAFADWAHRTGGRAVIGRVFNLAGPYINKLQSYALAAFIGDALADRPIEIRATRPVYRSYVAISELMSMVFGLLTDPGDGVIAFDTAGEETLEMQQMAEAVQTALGKPHETHRPPMETRCPDIYVGDRRVYSQLCRSQYVEAVDFPAQVLETATFMTELFAGRAARLDSLAVGPAAVRRP